MRCWKRGGGDGKVNQEKKLKIFRPVNDLRERQNKGKKEQEFLIFLLHPAQGREMGEEQSPE